MNIKQLLQRRADLNAEELALRTEGKAALDAAAAGNELSDAERKRDDEIQARLAEISTERAANEAALANAQQIAELERQAAGASDVVVGHDLAIDAPFANDGEFYAAVVDAGSKGIVDPRLFAAASGGSTGVPSDGGFFVGRERSMRLMQAVGTQSVLKARCDSIELGDDADGVELPYIDETSRANGSRFGGVRVYRRAEAASVTATKPSYAMLELQLEDLMGLTYMTRRQLRNAAVTKQIVERAFASEFAFTVDSEVFNGNGAGRIKGAFSADNGSLIVVTKETKQAAATIVYENITKMWARLDARCRANSAWFVGQDSEPQLQSMSLVIGTGGVPVYLPPGGLSGSPYGTLYGRPVIPLEYCSVLGTQNDIVLGDISQMLLVEQGGMESAESIHVRFLQAESAFRWIIQINGAPKWRTALTPFNGGPTQSPFITLATR